MRVLRWLCLPAYVWLCCCYMACDPYYGDEYKPGYVKALKPASVDSLEMRVYSNDSLVATEYSLSSENGSEASFFLRDYYEDDKLSDKNCDFNIVISLFCGDRMVDLPTYMVKSKTDSRGLADEVKYYMAEFDERKVSGDYTLETFLTPEDTSCGKFVNYAVLKVED